MNSLMQWRHGTRQLVIALLTPFGALTFSHAQTFTPTGRMNFPRSHHQATMLLDGRVLASGGSDDAGTGIAQAEIFDPVTRTWSGTGTNVIPRLEHAAALLHDGRLLVVGGVSSFPSRRSKATAETYDPATGTWSLTEELPIDVGRGPIAVRLPDGRVLVSGGGTRCGDVFDSAALFNPSTSRWSTTASMTVPRQFHTATLISDGRVLVTGGAAAGDGVSIGAEIYDPATAAWTPVGSAAPPVGTACDGYLRTYASLFQSAPSLVSRATADDCSSVTLLPGAQFVVAGGTSTSGAVHASAELFDPASGIGNPIGLCTPRGRGTQGHDFEMERC